MAISETARRAIRAMSKALDYIAVAKATKDDKARGHMIEAQDRIVLAIYHLNPSWLSPFDEKYLLEKGLLEG